MPCGCLDLLSTLNLSYLLWRLVRKRAFFQLTLTEELFFRVVSDEDMRDDDDFEKKNYDRYLSPT